MAVQPGLAGLGSLLRLRGRAGAPAGPGGAAGLACGRIVLGTARPISTPASIGIEIANPGHPAGLPPFADAQIAERDRACQGYRRPMAHRADRVLGHSDVAPGPQARSRRAFSLGATARGRRRPLGRARAHQDGRFFGAGDQGMPVEALQAMLAMYGYGLRITGSSTRRREGRRGLSAAFPARAHRRRRRCLDDHHPARPDRHTATTLRMTKS